ncbi:HD-GYP domain-containing protein [Deinococcus altitudinis]|uniref:HD-GYP domain-containing protein n=1 Tax=Deinococcus altitudinis TaxID=468914 RepID=UPI0038919B6A
MPTDEAGRSFFWPDDDWPRDGALASGNVHHAGSRPRHGREASGPLNLLRALSMDPEGGQHGHLADPDRAFGVQGYPPRVVPEAVQRLMSLTESLARMLGQRVDETLEHTARVVELAGRMAQSLNFSPDRREALIWGARLHDIGKLAVPPEVLHKQGALNTEEWRAMRGHVEAGQAIAESLDCLPWISMCVLAQHHERWNGGGYPLGLAGDDICLEARVFAFCDVYDALTHARSYKPAWTRGRALREIRRLTGSFFDPDLLGAFVQVVSELPEQF